MADTVMLNGIAYSSQNVTLTVFGRNVIGITKLDYKAKQAKTNNMGFQKEPVSRGYGGKEYEGSIEVYKEEWQAIINAAPLNDPTAIPPFTMSVQFSGDGVLFNQDDLLFVEFLEDPLSVGAGDTSIKLTIPLIIGGIKHS